MLEYRYMVKQFKNSKLRIPPQNVESEQALLGSIMLKPEVLYDIADTITPEVFYSSKHGLVYEGMLDLFNKKEPIDILSLSSRLKEKDVFDAIGGDNYLAELVNCVPSSANAKH